MKDGAAKVLPDLLAVWTRHTLTIAAISSLSLRNSNHVPDNEKDLKMFDSVTGADPYVFYKIHHVDRARYAWILSEDLGIFPAYNMLIGRQRIIALGE